MDILHNLKDFQSLSSHGKAMSQALNAQCKTHLSEGRKAITETKEWGIHDTSTLSCRLETIEALAG